MQIFVYRNVINPADLAGIKSVVMDETTHRRLHNFPGMANFVITANRSYVPDDCFIGTCLGMAIRIASSNGIESMAVIGKSLFVIAVNAYGATEPA